MQNLSESTKALFFNLLLASLILISNIYIPESFSIFWDKKLFYSVMFTSVLLAFFWKRNFRKLSFPMWFSFIFSSFSAFLLKIPSIRSSAFFGLLIPIYHASKPQFYFFSAFALLENLINNTTESFLGTLIGLFWGLIFTYLERKFSFSKKITSIFKNKFELRRQYFHAFLGLLIIFLTQKEILNLQILGFILILGGILVIICKKREIPFIYEALKLFEREKHIKRFPGKGSFFLVLGSFFSIYFFPPAIAFASIIILSLGDSINNIFGRQWGRIVHPFNPKKNIEGIIAGIFASFFACLIFVSPTQAFFGSLFALTVESFEIRIYGFRLDDNLLIPLISGATMLLLA